MTPSIKEALAWADQPLDRCIERDLPALKAFHVLAAALREREAHLALSAAVVEAAKECYEKVHADYASGQRAGQKIKDALAALTKPEHQEKL